MYKVGRTGKFITNKIVTSNNLVTRPNLTTKRRVCVVDTSVNTGRGNLVTTSVLRKEMPR